MFSRRIHVRTDWMSMSSSSMMFEGYSEYGCGFGGVLRGGGEAVMKSHGFDWSTFANAL